MDAIYLQNIQQTKQYNSTLSTIAIDQATSSEIWYYFSQFNPSTLLRSNATTAMQHKLQIKPEASNDNRANKLQQPYMQILYGANYLLGLPNFWMIISWQRHSSQILVRTSVKQRSILGLHKLQLHAYLLRPLNDGQYCYCSELCPC